MWTSCDACIIVVSCRQPITGHHPLRKCRSHLPKPIKISTNYPHMHLKSNRKNKTNKMTDIFTSNITHNVAPVDPSDNIGSVDKPLYCNQRDAVIYFPCSVEQMTKYISEFKQILFDSFWKYTCEVNRAGVLNLFYGYRRQPSVAKYTLTHIQPHILQTMLPPKHHDWWEITKLPLDEQRKLAAA